MEEVIVLENYVDDQCVRHVHLMSNTPFVPAEHFPQIEEHDLGEGSMTYELGVYHFRAKYPYHGFLEIKSDYWPKSKTMVVWSLKGCITVKVSLFDAAEEYEQLFRRRPLYAFMQKLPKGVENGVNVGDLILFQCEWMLNRCVAVF